MNIFGDYLSSLQISGQFAVKWVNFYCKMFDKTDALHLKGLKKPLDIAHTVFDYLFDEKLFDNAGQA